MTSEEIRTSLDDLIELIAEKGGVKLDQAKEKLGLDEESVMNLARILQSHEIVKIYYSIVGETILKPGKKFYDNLAESKSYDNLSKLDSIGKAKEDAKSNIKQIETGKIDEILKTIRKRIMEKKKKKLEEE